MGSSARMIQLEPQLQQKNADNQFNQRRKETSSVIHETCEGFDRMLHEQLQEFAMILIKKYHSSFFAEFFDDYCGSFNPEEFLKMEQSNEKSRWQEIDLLLTFNVEWKKYTGLGGIDKEGDYNNSAGSNNNNSGALVQGVWAKGELKEHTNSFGKVLDEDVPNDNHGSPKLELNDAVNQMTGITRGSKGFLELERSSPTEMEKLEEQITPQDAPTKRLQGNNGEAFDEAREEAKTNLLPLVARAWAEEFGGVLDQKFVENGIALDQENLTKGPSIYTDIGAGILPPILERNIGPLDKLVIK
ncbi:uncharacterized protein LOC127799296 [Diospyros lotus]|uniref:uncharacterized protein LOC127799296 n=1 Tax=Diospyros lotus TaxID=55363 RepID=UPI002256125A|nr:uncharacterized protein LOC127799296 [Diospyros lotus]